MYSKFLVSIIFSLISIVVSGFAIAIVLPHRYDMAIDYQGVISGVLSFSVTLLLGWQIFQSINLAKKVESYQQKIDNLQKNISEELQIVDKEISENEAFGYAIVDFCQSYIMLKVDTKNYYDAYCKSLNAFRNFLKSKEDLYWYAPTCLDNMSEALRLAIDKNNIFDANYENKIQSYLEEIRKCTKQGFQAYWNRLINIEEQRKKRIT